MRKLLFWAHLSIGATAAAVIFIMSVTGVLLMYERQIVEWRDRHYRSSPAGVRLAPEELLRAVTAQTGTKPDSITIRAGAEAPVQVTAHGRTLYVDASTGRVLGESNSRLQGFFRAVTSWHRWLALSGQGRDVGRAITGAANLIFFCLAVSGIYLWMPRRWTWNNVRAVLWFRRGIQGKARDFNWHNAIGIWSALPLIGVILGALVISYPWAANLIYRIAGSELPTPQKGPSRIEPGPADRGELAGLDRAVAQAAAAVPQWQSISWRAEGGDRVVVNISGSHRGRIDLRSTLTVDRATGRVLKHEQFSDLSRGRRWRLWLRFIHTGEALGVAGQTLAGLVSAGAALLAWTGVALSWRRFSAWRTRRRIRRA